ncbi:MAG: M15 family metallopeptidase, partial [Actinomycetota bacterium]
AAAAFAANLFWGRADPVLGEPNAPILLTWTSESNLPRLAEAAREIDGIGAVATARNGVGWLDSWSSTDGPATAAPEGFRIPVEVLAVVPEDYSAFVPVAQRELFEGLAGGGALLGESAAELRGIESAGILNFSVGPIPVAGVVPDNLLASHEVVMSLETAQTLGISDLKYILVELERGTSEEEAEQALREGLPDGSRLGARSPGEAEVFRPGGTILPQVEIKKEFGEFAARPGRGRAIIIDPKWIVENTTNVAFPLVGSGRCHNKVIPQIRGAFQDVIDRGLANLVRRGDFGGCFSPRFLNSDPNSGISHHSWGIAIDFNVSQNPYGVEPKMDMRLVELLESHGLTWGGHWVVPDGMHFEYLREP